MTNTLVATGIEFARDLIIVVIVAGIECVHDGNVPISPAKILNQLKHIEQDINLI